jgi:C4-type Zn-finger protein
VLQDPNQSSVNNLNNIRPEGNNRFRNKTRTYLKAKTDDLETKSKTKNITDLYKRINNFKKGYQPRTNIVMDKASDLVTGSHSI